VLLELGGEPGRQPGVRLVEQADGGDPGIVERVLVHPFILAVLDTGNIAGSIVAAAVVGLLNQVFHGGQFP
jgi:hypothetical protein